MSFIRTGSLALTLVATVAGSLAAGEPTTDGTAVSRLAWRRSYRQAVEEARRRKRPILVKVTATWCGPCRQMQQLTFTDEQVRRRLRRDFVLLELDADENQELIADFKVETYPTTLVVSPELTIVKRVAGFKSASDLVTVLEMVRSKDAPEEEDEDDAEPASALAVANAVPTGNAFDGFCLTSLLDDNKLRKGDDQLTTVYKGQTVCFHSEEHRRRFLADPDRYWPVADGQCLVSTREGRMVASGDPRVGVIWRGKLWFFSDRETQQRFIQTPHQYAGSL